VSDWSSIFVCWQLPLHAAVFNPTPDETAKKERLTTIKRKREDCPLEWPLPSLSGVFPTLALIQIE
jgi:hypothetical protein